MVKKCSGDNLSNSTFEIAVNRLFPYNPEFSLLVFTQSWKLTFQSISVQLCLKWYPSMVEGIDKSMVHPENAALLSTKKKLATKPQKDKQKPKCILLSERSQSEKYYVTLTGWLL